MIIKIEAGRITSLGLLSKMESGMSKAYNFHENVDVRKFKICGIIVIGARRATNLWPKPKIEKIVIQGFGTRKNILKIF